MGDTEAAVKTGAEALCKLHGAGGCSMHCTVADQHVEQCPRAVRVWGHEARAVVEAIQAATPPPLTSGEIEELERIIDRLRARDGANSSSHDVWRTPRDALYSDAAAGIDRLLSSLKRTPPSTAGWLPISTAPKDQVILVADEDRTVHLVSWGDCCPGYPNSPRMRWCVNWSYGEHGYHIIEHPILWRPVPEVPAPSQEGQT